MPSSFPAAITAEGETSAISWTTVCATATGAYDAEDLMLGDVQGADAVIAEPTRLEPDGDRVERVAGRVAARKRQGL